MCKRLRRLLLAMLALAAVVLILSGATAAEATDGASSDHDTAVIAIQGAPPDIPAWVQTAEVQHTGKSTESVSERPGAVDRSAEGILGDTGERRAPNADLQDGNNSGAELNLVGIEAPAAVATSENLEVTYTLENIGNETGTESAVNLLIGSTQVDQQQDVTVGPGETTNGTLIYEDISENFEDGDTVFYTVQLSETGVSSDGEASILGPELGLLSIDAPAEVKTNESLEIDYTIENIGNETGTESEVGLLVDAEMVDADTDVTVQVGETVNGTLVFSEVGQEYQDGDSIEYTVALSTFNEARGGSADVVFANTLPPGLDIQVDSIEAPTEISIGDTLPVNYAIENVGNQSGVATATLVVEGETVDSSENITLDAGREAFGTLVFNSSSEQFEPGDVIGFTVELSRFESSIAGSTQIMAENGTDNETGDDNDTGDDNQTGDGALEVTSIESPDIIDPDVDLVVNYTIVNAGDTAATESFVDLRVDGAPVDSDEDVTVQPGESVSGSLSYNSAAYEEGETIEFSVELFDFGDSLEGETFAGTLERSGAVTIQGPVKTDSSSVSVVIESIEDLDGNGWLVVENLDTGLQSGLTAVSEGDFESVSLESIGGVRFGDTIEVRLAADSEFTNVLDTTTTTVEAGENDPIAAFGWNPGVPDTGQPVAFNADNSRGGGSEITEYRWDFDNDGEFERTSESSVAQHTFESGGQQEVRLVVENEVGLSDETVQTITVRETLAPAEPALSSLSIGGQGSQATIEGGDASVSVTVTNVGEETDQFTLQLSIGSSVTETTSTAGVDGQESDLVIFENVTGVLDPGTHQVTVSAGNKIISGEVTVEAGPEPEPEPSFTVSILETNSPITAGENLTVTAEVENIGNGSGTATVELDGGEFGGDTASVVLDSGESATETLTITAETENVSEFVVTASVGGDERTATVTVEENSDGTMVTPILVFVLLLILLLIGGMTFYFIYDDGGSGAAMEEL